MRGQPDGRRGIALRRLGQNLALRNFRHCLHNLGAQMVIGENPQALGREHGPRTIHRLLNQGPLSEKAEHLFRVRAAAARPEARAAASRKDEAVMASVRHQPSGYP